MKKLQNSQQQIYEFLLDFYNKNGFPPTVREICAAVGLNSTSTVHTHLSKLEQRGLIKRNPAKQRSITITPPTDGELELHQSTRSTIPLVGNIAAGVPITALENIEDEMVVPPLLSHGGNRSELFILKVEGSSMMDAGILSGDYIVVHNGLQVENGDIIVARIQGERATVKKFYREQDRVRLQPQNAQMQPIYVAYSDVEIVGKVVGLMRSY